MLGFLIGGFDTDGMPTSQPTPSSEPKDVH